MERRRLGSCFVSLISMFLGLKATVFDGFGWFLHWFPVFLGLWLVVVCLFLTCILGLVRWL